MPSLVIDYVPGSGYSPLFSGNLLYSGRQEPIGGVQLRANLNNSGNIYISLSGANFFSGQVSTLPASGGPTINSGAMFLSGGMLSGRMDGMPLSAGDAYFLPRIAIPNTGGNSGVWNTCVGCDPACSGQARLHVEIF